MKEAVMWNICSPELFGYEHQFSLLYDLIIQTVNTGRSNSVLLLGPRGSGKSLLVSKVLTKARFDSKVLMKDGVIVYLHGLLETNDKLALKTITKELDLENVQGDRVFGSFAEHLEFLLSSLRSGDRNSKPIVFVLEEFHLFCAHHNQTLLYNLFDVAQSNGTPMVVIGISPELDVLESLEKRVRSRFNHRQIDMFPPLTFDEYSSIIQKILTPKKADMPWAKKIDQLVKSHELRSTLEQMYHANRSIAYAKQILALAFMDISDEMDIANSIKKAFVEQSKLSGEPPILAGLTLIETCILVAIKHIQVIYDGQPFNFEMAFHEFDKFVSTKAKILKTDRALVMKAWETLIDLEIITPVDRGTKIQKEFKLHTLQVFPEAIEQSLENVPQNVREWANSGGL